VQTVLVDVGPVVVSTGVERDVPTPAKLAAEQSLLEPLATPSTA